MNTTGNFQEICSSSVLMDDIYSLDQAEFPKPWSISDWQSIHWQHHFLYAQLIEQDLSGFVLFSRIDGDDQAHLLKICIASKRRGHGHALALWNFSLAELEKKEVKSVYLEVEAENLQAIKFYEKVGFIRLRSIKGYYSNGGSALTMQLTL